MEAAVTAEVDTYVLSKLHRSVIIKASNRKYLLKVAWTVQYLAIDQDNHYERMVMRLIAILPRL